MTLRLCDSCLKERTEDELGMCLDCGADICGIGDCKGTCLCDYESRKAGEDE